MRSLASLCCSLAIALTGCEGADETELEGTGGSIATVCPPGERLVGDACLGAGVQDTGCSAGEVVQSEGACAPAGVPPDACAPGFEPFEDGCVPILPSAPCEDGLMATPGETRCRAIAPCGTGTWGAIPIESNTQHVDGSYTGGDSDGTAAKPWTSIQAAIVSAPSGATVAVAAGSYAEQVDIVGKPVRLWGRCPDMVEIVTPMGTNGIYVGVGSAGSEIRDLAIRGDTVGMVVMGGGVHVDRVWVHDTSDRGIYLEGTNELTMTRSLVEATSTIGISAFGGILTIEDSVVRDTQPEASGNFGRGIEVDWDASAPRTNLSLRRSVVSNNHNDGVMLVGIEGSIEATVVQDTQSAISDGRFGGGIVISAGPSGRANVVVDSCVVTNNHYAGIEVVGSDATIDATTVRDTLPQTGNGEFGAGLSFYDSSAGERPNVTVTSSAVSGSHGEGVWLDTADAVIEGTVVRDTAPALELRGRGLNVTEHGAGPSVLTMRASLVANSHEAAVVVAGSSATFEGVALRDTQPDPLDQLHGVGILVQDFTGGPGDATIAKCVVENNHDIGIWVASADALIDATLVRYTQPIALDQKGGEGIQVQPAEAGNHRPTVTVRDSIVEHNLVDGLINYSSDVHIEHSLVRATQLEVARQLAGDGVTAASVVDLANPARIAISDSRIEANARAGVSNFGAVVGLDHVVLDCNAISMAAESHFTIDPVFEDHGGNVCACGSVTTACKAATVGLAPPEPPEPP